MARPRGGHNFNWRKHPDIDERLHEIYYGRYSQDIADQLNAEFGTSFTGVQICKHLANHGITLGVGKNRKGHRFFWTDEKRKFVEDRLDKSYDEIIADFEKEFGVRLTWGSLGHMKWRSGFYSENDGRYKPGILPANHSELGAESDKGSGYTWVKVSDKRWTGNGSKNNWLPKQRVVWEAAYGPVPPGMYVTFRDGDRSNFELSNLKLVTRAELNYMTKMGTKKMEPSIRETGELVAKLRASIYEKEKNDGNDNQRT